MSNIIEHVEAQLNYPELEQAIIAEIVTRLDTADLAEAFVDEHWDAIMERLTERFATDLLPF